MTNELLDDAATALAFGQSADSVYAKLVASGVSSALATRAVSQLIESPFFGIARSATRAAQRYAMAAAIQRAVARQAPQGVSRRVLGEAGGELTSAAFNESYYAASRPVVLERFAADWPAMQWTPESMAARIGDVTIEVTTGRERDPDYEQHVKDRSMAVPFAVIVKRLVAQGEIPTNDWYVVANNRAMEKPEFLPLLQDLKPDQVLFDPAKLVGGVSLWLGPAGTITPWHHDNTNIMLVQLRGKKRVRVAPPTETALLDAAKEYVSNVPAKNDPTWYATDLAPGDALFLPVGWWHHVVAFEPSISLSLTGFRRDNRFDWYKPGGIV